MDIKTDLLGVPVSATAPPYFRLSGFYLFYFASLGAFLPYWGPYLKHLSFEPEQIGELTAVIMATKIVAPNVWGWVVDHYGHRLTLIRIASLLATVCFAMLIGVTGYWWIIAGLALFSFFWNASLPQFEAMTLNYLGESVHQYSQIRVWGSIGFIVSVMGLAWLFESFSIEILPIVVTGLLAAIWINTLFIKDCLNTTTLDKHARIFEVIIRPEVTAFLFTCCLAQASHGPYYTFFSIYLEDSGYSKEAIGALWALGVIAEVAIFLVMHRGLLQFRAVKLLQVALLLTVIRWLIIATQVHSLPLLIIAQILHAASFGVLHGSAIHLIHQYFPGRLQGRGQALYSSISFGLGGAFGSILSGYAWTRMGPSSVYLIAAILAGIGLIISGWAVRPLDE